MNEITIPIFKREEFTMPKKLLYSDLVVNLDNHPKSTQYLLQAMYNSQAALMFELLTEGYSFQNEHSSISTSDEFFKKFHMLPKKKDARQPLWPLQPMDTWKVSQPAILYNGTNPNIEAV